MDYAELLLQVTLGLGLAAACGLRVFVPVWVASLSAYTGYLTPALGFEWLGSPPALIVLSIAAVVEGVAFLVPWVDHALDALAAPAAVVAGAVLAGAFVGDVDPLLRWTLLAVAGGGAAGVVHGGAALTRATSTALTGGIANPVFAVAETSASLFVAALAVVVPVFALFALLLAGATVWSRRSAQPG